MILKILDSLRGKKEMVIPEELQEFPKCDENILSGPKVVKTYKYTRATYYVRNADNYIVKLLSLGYIRKSDVRFDRNDKDYIIVEKEGLKTKIAFHKVNEGY